MRGPGTRGAGTLLLLGLLRVRLVLVLFVAAAGRT